MSIIKIRRSNITNCTLIKRTYLKSFGGVVSRTTSSSLIIFFPIGAKPPKRTQNSPESDSACNLPSSIVNAKKLYKCVNLLTFYMYEMKFVSFSSHQQLQQHTLRHGISPLNVGSLPTPWLFLECWSLHH